MFLPKTVCKFQDYEYSYMYCAREHLYQAMTIRNYPTGPKVRTVVLEENWMTLNIFSMFSLEPGLQSAQRGSKHNSRDAARRWPREGAILHDGHQQEDWRHRRPVDRGGRGWCLDHLDQQRRAVWPSDQRVDGPGSDAESPDLPWLCDHQEVHRPTQVSPHMGT